LTTYIEIKLSVKYVHTEAILGIKTTDSNFDIIENDSRLRVLDTLSKLGIKE